MTRVAFFSSKSYDKHSFNQKNSDDLFTFEFHKCQLTDESARLASGCEVVCAFVNDDLSSSVLKQLAKNGTRLIALRCCGHDKVDLKAAHIYGMQVVHVPEYSPESVAEHAVGLMLTLNRKLHKAYMRTREADFSLEGLVGYNLHQKTAGIIGVGAIGLAVIRILTGFGMNVLCYDPYQDPAVHDLGAKYCSLEELLTHSDIISLHCPSTPNSFELLNQEAIELMKDGVMLINTSRADLLETSAIIKALKRGKIGGLGLDVYCHERANFFHDDNTSADDLFRQLSTSHNVIFTGHQAFLTTDALDSIATITMQSLSDFFETGDSENQLIAHHKVK